MIEDVYGDGSRGNCFYAIPQLCLHKQAEEGLYFKFNQHFHKDNRIARDNSGSSSGAMACGRDDCIRVVLRKAIKVFAEVVFSIGLPIFPGFVLPGNRKNYRFPGNLRDHRFSRNPRK